MHEIKQNLDSLSLFVGTGICNANCSHCAGRPLRKFSPKKDGQINKKLIHETIEGCYKKGAKSISITSTGEPTLSPLSVTKVLRIIKESESRGIKFSKINLYSNGIRIGNDKIFAIRYLKLWKKLGLKKIYITVHNIQEKENAKIYRIKKYPSLKTVVERIHNAKLLVRANLILSTDTIKSYKEFKKTIKELQNLNFDSISAWSIRDMQDNIDKKRSLDEIELQKIKRWVRKQNSEKYITILTEQESRKRYQKGEKLTLFPNGKLSNTWCN